MPDETVPSAATPDSTERRDTSSGLVALGCGGAALVGVLVLVVTLAWGSWGATDFPRVAPEEMAGRAFQRSQEAHEIMGSSGR
ncbi:hypothetical protein ACIGEZ_32140 [Streptomyces sp. NPDC085481]|uniref:hypothetical protein n=1 Tax=Streptomyces sp. NPDC085481 TaxID=3365727 RepID=UPI0037D4BA0B